MRSVSVRYTVTVSTRGGATSPGASFETGIRRVERACAEADEASKAMNAAPATSSSALRFSIGFPPSVSSLIDLPPRTTTGRDVSMYRITPRSPLDVLRRGTDRGQSRVCAVASGYGQQTAL